MGVKTEIIVSALKGFQGVRHRIETLGEIDGVRFVDDSKGTNVDATIKAVASMSTETILLLGGKNKGYDYDKLFAYLLRSKVEHAVLYGENRYALLKSAQSLGFENLSVCDTFSFAVRIAALKAKAGQTVLLSPASASFDEFASYEERLHCYSRYFSSNLIIFINLLLFYISFLIIFFLYYSIKIYIFHYLHVL